jgi:Nitrile hydratase beta subunit, C-terminal
MTYRVGESIVVADRAHRGHHRTPSYIKGKTGRIERVHAAFRNPETRAYGDDGLPQMRLYLVSFARSDLWPDVRAGRSHRVYADVFEHWLEEAK